MVDADGMSAEVDGEEISLTTREFNIIYKLLSYPKKTFSRAQLMDEFWDLDSDTSLRAVDVYMTKLRNKLSGCDGFKFPFFLYKWGVRKQTEKMNPLIEAKYDEIYEICEKGNKLLN